MKPFPSCQRNLLRIVIWFSAFLTTIPIYALGLSHCLILDADKDYAATHTAPPKALATKNPHDPRYATPLLEQQYREEFPMAVFDLEDRDLADPDVLAQIRGAFDALGAIHVVHNRKYTTE